MLAVYKFGNYAPKVYLLYYVLCDMDYLETVFILGRIDPPCFANPSWKPIKKKQLNVIEWFHPNGNSTRWIHCLLQQRHLRLDQVRSKVQSRACHGMHSLFTISNILIRTGFERATFLPILSFDKTVSFLTKNQRKPKVERSEKHSRVLRSVL